MADEPISVVPDTSKTDTTSTTVTSESGPLYATLKQRFNSVKLICLIFLIVVPVVVGLYKGYTWVDGFLYSAATGALYGLFFILGVRTEETKKGNGK